MTENLVDIRNLNVRFSGARTVHAINDLTLTLKQGETMALLGGFVIAFLHNGMQVVFLAIQSGAASTSLTLSVWLGSAVYTALVGTLFALFAVR